MTLIGLKAGISPKTFVSEKNMAELKPFEVVGGLMNVGQLLEYLGIPISTIYVYSMRGKIPHFHIGKLLRFRRADIDTWLENGGCDGSELGS